MGDDQLGEAKHNMDDKYYLPIKPDKNFNKLGGNIEKAAPPKEVEAQ